MTASLSPRKQGLYIIAGFRESDAGAIVQLFREAYGDNYLKASIYDPETFIAGNRSQQLISVVARTASGEVVGHVGLSRCAPSPKVLEIGQAVVGGNHRSGGLLAAMMSIAIEHARGALECELLFGAAVCNHAYSQKACLSLGLTEIGYEMDYLPERMFVAAHGPIGRVATLNYARSFAPDNDTDVYLPPCYAGNVRDVVEHLGDRRRFHEADASAQPGGESELTVGDMPDCDVVAINLTHAGADFETRLLSLEQEARSNGRAMIKVAVNLGQPEVAQVVEVLRSREYFCGCVLPRWFGSDALLMIKTFGAPNFAGLKIKSERSHDLRDRVEQDYLSVVAARKAVAA
ncbi:GNAT family N-acetyltransferase [Denitrobaculum tricleocarpae]|uniref:GNAT family N-acetyltransferase n=1 Tax=Denitrobaculum tricleocarpae TaxID=2591009 RepID=A0A545U369_9PROT|nr:GNAT family N-acetyltransferase [Denitrobaculum tricleocarpae]TQV83864.1 GNAT family N-acetyltransferase [Denitrobaculum tricleocarpae]